MTAPLRIAVIGGGINGICTAHQLAKAGASVVLFEQDQLMQATSSNSSKLLHGGLRYLEHMEFKLVHESLRERAWWIKHGPAYCHPLAINIPIYKTSRRPGWMIKLGLTLYDLLAGKKSFGQHISKSRSDFLALNPLLKPEGLKKGFTFFDGQMDDYALGMWMVEQARSQGVEIREHHRVEKLDCNGNIQVSNIQENDIQENNIPKNNESYQFDYVVNVAGPWAEQLLNQSGVYSPKHIDAVRGSHIVLPRKIDQAYLLEVPWDKRIFFVLPWKNSTLVGTTEVQQSPQTKPEASEQEIDYLLNAYNHYFQSPASHTDIIQTFSGIRPLIKSRRNPTRASREYFIDSQNKLFTVYGGKWTTARSLAKSVCKRVLP